MGFCEVNKELKLGGPNGPSECLSPEGMEMMSKQRKPAQKDSERGIE